MATDKELEQKRSRVEKLREQRGDLIDKHASMVREASNDIEMARLEAEEARLQQEVETLKAAANARAVKEGVSTLADQIKGAVEGEPVDTTPEGNSDGAVVPDKSEEK